jgi:hypothetical protein
VTPQSAAVAEGRVISHNDSAYVTHQEVVEIRPMVQAMAPHIQAPVPSHIQALRSEHLNRLTSGPTGRPTLDVALDPANFPFIQGTTQAAPVKHGVVKIKNVSLLTRCLSQCNGLLTSTLDPILHQASRDHRLLGSELEDPE